MGRSRFPGKPHKFHNKKRINILLDAETQNNDSEFDTGCINEETERQNEVEGETSKEREKSGIKEGEEGEVGSGDSSMKKSFAGDSSKMQTGRGEAGCSGEFHLKVGPPQKKTVTFGSVESCSDVINPNRKIPSKTMQPLVSIIKKKSAFKPMEHTAFHSIVKPAKLTDLGSKPCVDFSTLRAKHNKSPPVKKSSLKFSHVVGLRPTSPPPDKDQISRKFVLPSHSAHSSRVIKPNKRFMDSEETLPPSPSSTPTPQSSAKVLKKPKLILTGDSNNPCYDEAYETCDSSANSNDSSDSKHLDLSTNSLLPSKSVYLDKTLGLFGAASLKNNTPSFQDTFVSGLKTLCQIADKNEDSEVNSCELNLDSTKMCKDPSKDGSSKHNTMLQLTRDISDIPCQSDQSSSSTSTSETSESEASLMSDSESEDSDEINNRLTIVDKGHVQTQSQLLSGKVILREARLQLNTINNNNTSNEGPFSTFGSTNTSSGNSPGTVTCGVCNAVRFYKLVKQAKKFGIYACESCRKFISKMIKKYGSLQSSPATLLQCLNGDGNCRVPPILRSQEWKSLRCAYKTRCHACWLKLCLKSFQVPAPYKAALQLTLPSYMRPSANIVQTVLPENTSPLRPSVATPTIPSISIPEMKVEEPAEKSSASIRNSKPVTTKNIQDDEPKKIEEVDIPKNMEYVEDDSSSNRKRRHTRIKVRKKEKPNSRHESDSTKRQKMELKGPRVKHVCRSASIVLGQPIATFPSTDDKDASDVSDDNSLSDIKKAEMLSKEMMEKNKEDPCMDCDESDDKPTELTVVQIEPKVEMEDITDKEIKEDSTDSFDSTIFMENKENVDIATNFSNTDSSSEDNESKASDIEQTTELILKKTKMPLSTISTVRQKANQQRNTSEMISTDFWESYDPEEVCSTGWGLINSLPFTVSSACFLCASKGKEKLVYCTYCCEPYHTFCVDGGCESNKYGGGWVCSRCEQCAACGGRGGATTACQSCRSKFHSACLAAGRAGQRADWPQICNACFKCKSCDSSKITKFLGSLPFCQSCFKLRQKGNYCPLCQGCYQDNDFDSKMMECGWCSRWVHAQCEGLSGEGYQLLSALPPSVEYVCRQCQPHAPPWRGMLTTYLRSKLKAVLKALAKNKNACMLLKLTPHKTTPVTKTPCICSSPHAVRKLTFDGKQDSKSSELNSEVKIKDRLTSENLGNNYLEASLSQECMETAKGTVHKLQESLLQNNEICLSMGSFETKERNVTNLKYKDHNRNRGGLLHPSVEDKDSEIEDDSDSCNSDTPITLLRSEMKTMEMTERTETIGDISKCSCTEIESESCPSFMDVKRRVNSDEYFSVKDFNGDMMDALLKTPEVKQVYKEIFAELFPWFDCETNCLNPSLEIEDENDDIESLKDEDISMYSRKPGKFLPDDHLVPSLENSNSQSEFSYEDVSLEETRICVLCKASGEGDPSVEGRLLYCGQGDWIHANCALWSAEVFEEIDGSLQNIQSAISRGRLINCAKCNNKGASVGCCAKNCSETYHFACARNVGCAFLDDKRVFCPQHVSEAEDKELQKDKDFDLTRPVYVELDRKKKKYCDPQKVHFLLGSLVVKCLGRIIPSVSDYEDFLIPVDFLCTRLYWSTKEPWKIVKYTIRTKLILVEPTPAYDLGVNITLDHSLNPLKVERILAEINSWHKSLETKSHSLMVAKKDKSPIKFGTARVSLEDYAVKQVMEHMLDIVCKQDHQDDAPEEEPQNTADLLPPELKDAIFEDLNHDLLDGISMQDIFPKLMSYEDLIAIDLKNEMAFANDISKDNRSGGNADDKKSADDVAAQNLKLKKNVYVSNNNSEHWLDGKTAPQDLIEDILNSQNDGAKKSKSELLLQGENLKHFANTKNRSLTWSCKFDGTLTSTLKRCKIPRPGLLSRSESNGNVVMVVDGTSDLLVSLASSKDKNDMTSDECEKWSTKPEKVSCEDSVSSELIIDTLGNADDVQVEEPTVSKLDKVSEKATEQVIDFYTKIHCSPISQLDGSADYSGQSDSESEPPMSPRDMSEVEFKPISQLDGADDMSSSSSESSSPPRDQSSTILFRPSGSDAQIAMTISSANLSNMNMGGELVLRSPADENILRINQVEQTVRCDRCHCTYRTKDSYNRHLPNCDMMSTSESEGETPKSPDSRTLTTLQNAFNGSFIQPTFINQQNAVYENSEQFMCPKPGMVGSRRTSVNTRQITINGTIVEKQSPGPSSPLTGNNDMSNHSQDMMNVLKTTKITPQNILPQPQLMMSHLPISPIKNQTAHCPKTGIIGNAGNFNICVKPNQSLHSIQNTNQTITQILPNSGNIQVLSSNPNQLLTISSPQHNMISNVQNKGHIMQGFSNIPNSHTITVPLNSIHGMPSSIANNINTFVRPTISFQNAPTILMPTSCASRMASPNITHKNHIFIPQNQKSPKKSPQVQPKPVFQPTTKGRGRTVNKNATVKRQNKLDKTMPNISPNIPLGANSSVIQFQNNGSTNQPSIIVQQVSNPNIMSYVEALQQQQQQQSPNMQYIATIASQSDFKPTTQYISQIPQTFQIQQTESGGLVAVPSGIPVFLPQGGVGILPQSSLQPQSVTISPQGTIQTQGATLLPQTAIQTQNGTTILPQATIQTQNGTATIIPQGLSQGNIQTSGPTIVSAGGIQSHNNLNNAQTSLIPQTTLQGNGNTLISQQPGTTILPQGTTILPQGLQFCNDQVILGSTPTLEMVTDSSGCMYLTTQPVYYGLETIVQNTVMSSQQFVSTAMQGVLAQNSSFSATTTQVFQASKIEPIVEMPTGYVVVNNVPQENIVVSQANVMPNQAPGNAGNHKNVKTMGGPNITIQPTAEKVTPVSNRQGIKTVSVQPNQPIFSIPQAPVASTLSIHPRNISTIPTAKQNIAIQPLQANVLHTGNIQLSNTSALPQGTFTMGGIPMNIGHPIVTSANSNMGAPKVQISISNNNLIESNESSEPCTSSNVVKTSATQNMWRSSESINKVIAVSSCASEANVSLKNVSSNITITQNQNANSNCSSVMQTSVSNSRTYTTSGLQQNFIDNMPQPKINHITESANVGHSHGNSFSNTMPTSHSMSSTVSQNSFISTQHNASVPVKDVEHSINSSGNNLTISEPSPPSNTEINQTSKQNMQSCSAHRNIPTTEITSNSVHHLPNSMMNLTMQGEKVYQLPTNAVNSALNNQQINNNCNTQIQFNPVNRNQNISLSMSNCASGQQQIPPMHNHAPHVNNNHTNQVHCNSNINNSPVMNSCNQHQNFGNNNQQVHNICGNQSQGGNSNNMQQLIMQQHNSNMHHMMGNNMQHNVHVNQTISSNSNQQYNTQNNLAMNQQLLGQNMPINSNQSGNQNSSMSNQQVMMNQGNAIANQHTMMNQNNLNQSHNMMSQNINSSNQQVMMNQNNMSSQQAFNMNNMATNQQTTLNQNLAHCNQQSLQGTASSNNTHQMMSHGNQHSMMSQINANMNSSNLHDVMNQNMQIINSNNQHQNNQPCSSNQMMGNMLNQHSVQSNQIQNHCLPINHNMSMQNNSNAMHMYNNQMHSIPTMNSNNLMNVCGVNRTPHVNSNNMSHHIMDQCSTGDNNNGNMMQVNNMNSDRNQIHMSINNTATNNNTNMMSSQMHIGKNQMPDCEIPSSNNANVPYQTTTPNTSDQMFIMSNNTNDSTNMQHANFNQHQIHMNQNQIAQNNLNVQNSHMHPQVNKPLSINQEMYSKNHNHDSVPNAMSITHLPSDGLSKLQGNHQVANNNKTINPHMMSPSPNHMAFSLNNTGNQMTNFSDNRNSLSHMTPNNTLSISNMNQIDSNRSSQVTPLPSNELMPQKMNVDSHEMRSCIGEAQNIEMPVINISNGALTIPPLPNILNKQIGVPQSQNNCVNSLANNTPNTIMSQISLTPNNLNVPNISTPSSLTVPNITISLPTQSTSSINLPKAPSHQSGIPTNVVNPIPQSMRPMNRVLPIHRDGQIAKAIPKPKVKVEPPKPPPPRSQDMPDLNAKDDDIVIEQDKTATETTVLTELEKQKKTLPTVEQSVASETPIVASVKTESVKSDDADSVSTSFKILIQKKGQSGNVYKISRKSINDKENLHTDIGKVPSQKLDIAKMAGSKLQNLPSIARKVNFRGKAGLDNRSLIKSTKHSPKKVPKDDGPKLVYEISSEDGFSYTSSSLSDLWGKVLEAVQIARKQHGLNPVNYSLPQSKTKMAEIQILGLNNNALKYLIEQLPGSSQCNKYTAKNGCKLPGVWQPDAEILRESPHGCARAGPAIRRFCSDTFSWLASPHRDPPPPLLDSEGIVSRRLASSTLPMAMRFRHLKETSKVQVGVYRSHIHRRGLFCRRDIEAGEMVIEYAGEVIRAALADQREKKYEAARGGRGVNGCYMFRVDDHLVVDATMKGNAARFINHSCDPNCFSKVVDILGHKHIIIFALRRIIQGEELTYDYKFPFEEVKIPCTCGAKKCRKYLN